MQIHRALLVAGIVAAGPAVAMTDIEAILLANSLASVLASEQACGLSYDQTAIAAFIAKEVPPERMDFASTLQTQTMGQEMMMADMSASAKAAHCAAIAQTAAHFGFTK